ncbi:peptidoglycan editing factor PgeF [Polynucleobacter sp. AP-Kolm-20A-A1]|uniref:peptidoglycan editing factor PgeF n=1 Tax=Polynucleobacter sp. AP-Kolm-20A-A1 TaxID=2081041 RepID=UPI001BFEAAAF|nr:peptidoglycan editing factor PgeF [Polynucleobacter sp. AP-Kolm-20A-A1]QWE21494.1 peptidoglycan editing factor PgeF [Polynucleobacter sp. AP-Kolm-20A-A1]
MNLITPQWAAPQNIHAFVTTRFGGVSNAPYDSLNLGDHVEDDLKSVLTNRALITAHLPSEPIWMAQTHSTIVSTPKSREHGNTSINADAAVSNIPGEVLTILTADCLPILFASKDGAVIGAAHAGWRGLSAGVIENTVADMRKLSSQLLAKDIVTWLGPAIGPDSFEVGEDVVRAFEGLDIPMSVSAFSPIAGKSGKYLANIYQLARARLSALGVHAIFGGDRCTVKEEKEFFSYRRDGKTGRFASFIWLSK